MLSRRPFSTHRRCALAMLVGALCAPVAVSAEHPELEWAEPLTVTTGEAHRGPWRMNESDFRFVDDPTLAIDANGDIVVVWVDQARQDVMMRRWYHESAQPPDETVNVSRSPTTFSWLPRVAVSDVRPEHVFVLWQEIVFSGGSHGGEIFFARSRDGGATFAEPLNLSNTQNGAGKGRLSAQSWHNGSLDLAEAPDGTLWAAWTEYEGRLLVAHSRDGGASFSPPLHVAGDEQRPARAPALAAGPDKRVHLAWTVGEDAAADIHYSVLEHDAAEFAETERVHDSTARADAPRLAVDGRGAVHLVWAEHPAAPTAPGSILHAMRHGDGRFSKPQRIDGAPGEAGRAGFPQLVVWHDRVHVVWEHFPYVGRRPQGLAVSWSANGGETFSPARSVPHSGAEGPGFNGGLQGLLMRKLAVAADGRIVLAHSLFRPMEQSEIRLLRAHTIP